MRTKMSDLHNILFETMERTLNPDQATPLTTESAMTIVKLAETVIAGGRAETEYLRAMVSLNPGGMHDSQMPKTTLFIENK
jgi:tRNA A37 threonylcarbamoyltransferase TsaD